MSNINEPISKYDKEKKSLYSPYYDIKQRPSKDNWKLNLNGEGILFYLALADVYRKSEEAIRNAKDKFYQAIKECKNEDELKGVDSLLQEAASLGGYAVEFYSEVKEMINEKTKEILNSPLQTVVPSYLYNDKKYQEFYENEMRLIESKSIDDILNNYLQNKSKMSKDIQLITLYYLGEKLRKVPKTKDFFDRMILLQREHPNEISEIVSRLCANTRIGRVPTEISELDSWLTQMSLESATLSDLSYGSYDVSELFTSIMINSGLDYDKYHERVYQLAEKLSNLSDARRLIFSDKDRIAVKKQEKDFEIIKNEIINAIKQMKNSDKQKYEELKNIMNSSSELQGAVLDTDTRKNNFSR